MGKIHAGVALLGLTSLLLAGCQNKLYDENLQLRQQNRELQTQLTDAQGRLREAPDPNESAAMRQQLADREAHIKDLEAQLKGTQPAAGNDPSIPGIETRYDPRAGTMTVTVPGDVLFESGQATLKTSAKATLDKVADAIKRDYATKPVFIDGHTDSDPINRTRDKWSDNWELSAERAHAVLTYLKTRGVDERNFTLRAYGPNKPRNANKAANRRVEIVVVTR